MIGERSRQHNAEKITKWWCRNGGIARQSFAPTPEPLTLFSIEVSLLVFLRSDGLDAPLYIVLGYAGTL